MAKLEMLGRHGAWDVDKKRGPLHLTFHFALIDGLPECVGLDVRIFRQTAQGVQLLGDEKPRPITSTLVRQLPVAELIEEAVREARDVRRWAADSSKGSNPKARKKAQRQLAAFETRAAGSRIHWDREGLEAVAQLYREALKRKESPTKAVGEGLNLSHSQAAKLVARCRREGLLGKTTPGKAGGIQMAQRKRG